LLFDSTIDTCDPLYRSIKIMAEQYRSFVVTVNRSSTKDVIALS
jgi:hypothetical protein